MKGSFVERLKRLRGLSPEYRAKLEGWTPTEDEARNLDFVFFDPRPMPPVFEEAVDLTRCSFAEWQSQIKRDGIPLVVALAENIEAFRPAADNGQLKRISAILDELRIPWFNLYPEFAKRGDVKDASIKFDGHWSSVGHKWAAESIFEYLKREGYLRPREEGASKIQ